MHRTSFDTRVLTDLAWWHWAVTVPLLAAHLSAFPWAIEAALLLCAAMALYYLLRIRGLLSPLKVDFRSTPRCTTSQLTKARQRASNAKRRMPGEPAGRALLMDPHLAGLPVP